MKNVGQKFKKARENQRLSITEISMATKISPKVLQSMEEGNLSQLPALSFLRGFVKTYASYLKLDAEELLLDFQKEYDQEMSPPSETDLAGVHSEPNKTAPSNDLHFIKEKSSTHLWLAAVGLLVLIGVVIGVNEVVEKYKKEATLVSPPEDLEKIEGSDPELPTPQVQAEAEPETGDEEAAEPKGTAPSAASSPQPVAGGESAQPTPQTQSQAPAVAAAPVVAPTPVTPTPVTPPVQTPTPAATPVVPAAPVAAQAAVTPPTPAAPATTPVAEVKPKSEVRGAAQEVILEALDRVVVTFKINEGPVEKVTLFPDQVHTIKLRGKVALDFSDGGAINVIVNGRDRGVPGDLGKPKKVTFP